MSLYKVCKFAKESNVLDVIFPDISPDEYFDDRLGVTLGAIHKFGIGNLELLVTRYIIEAFEIQTEICHNDTTCVQFYGDNNKNRSEKSIKISYSYNKQYRKDLKQLVLSMTASSDSSFPLFQQAYSGNTADVETVKALEIYRNKDLVEKAFNNLKERLNLRRVAVSWEQSLDGKLFVQFIALIFLSYITKKMQENNLFKDHTMQEVLDEFDIIECFEVPGQQLRVCGITKRQIDLYTKLGIKPPASLQ